jgi:glycosyltransferase involved in cell wall biosynthesis
MLAVHVGRDPNAEDIDIVLTYHPLLAWRLGTSMALEDVPLVAVFLSSWAEEYAVRQPGALPLQRALGYRVRLLLERRVLRQAARVLPMSAFMAHRLQVLHGLSADRVRIVPGGVDRTRFEPRDRKRARETFGLPADALVLLSLRNLEPRMGLDVLIDAMPAIRAQHAGAMLVIAGAGPLRRTLEARAADRQLDGVVRFTGFVPEERLADLYAGADLFVLPTQALEGFGLVTLEALACGIPVVGTPVGATPGLLAALDRSLLAESHRAGDLAAAIVRVLARPDLGVLRRQCRDYTTAYDGDVIVARLERELEAVQRRLTRWRTSPG